MDQLSGAGAGQADGRWRPGRVAGIAGGLLFVERLLVGQVGSPTGLVRTLLGLGDPSADPVISMLGLMTLIAEVMVGYLLLVLALRSLATLPGSMGHQGEVVHSARSQRQAQTPRLVMRGNSRARVPKVFTGDDLEQFKLIHVLGSRLLRKPLKGKIKDSLGCLDDLRRTD
jgi:hypothetical protein